MLLFSFMVPETFAAASDTTYVLFIFFDIFFIIRSHLGLDFFFKRSIIKGVVMLKYNISDPQVN